MSDEKLKEETKKWLQLNLIRNPLNVTLTEKQYLHKTVGKDNRIFKLDELKSSQNFRHFSNVLNKKVFGNGFYRFNKRLRMLVIREVSHTLRHHLHLIMEQPQRYSFEEFKKLIEFVWKKTNFGYSEIHIEKPTNSEREIGWFNYIMKNYNENSIDWNNTVLN
tara:strand:- start:27 stop:515 length:489 start_codon:yes stop_codon:yes gene_type:complete